MLDARSTLYSVDGVIVVGPSKPNFAACLFAPSSPECSMVDAPRRPECRTCWPRLGGENAMGKWRTKKTTCVAFRGVRCKQWIFFFQFIWLDMIREEEIERK